MTRAANSPLDEAAGTRSGRSDRDGAAALAGFAEPTRRWFADAFASPTDAQRKAWPSILAGQSTLLVAPTGSGKTLAAFLCAIDRLLFSPTPDKHARCRLVYVSPLKALAFDIEKNLRAPLAGIMRSAERLGAPFQPLEVAVRTGDTPADERARFLRRPADILITTPESLYLMLTSNARETLRSVESLIVDEIHAIAATKRGTHLFLSLERLQALREPGAPLQRIGLSATQKPLDEVARLLGGFARSGDTAIARPVAIADAHAERPIELTIEVPVEDMSELRATEQVLAPREGEQHPPKSIWTSIHPRLVELVRKHRSTMIFVNNRRLAERLAAAINELAGEPIARAHHGSVAREQRVAIEDALKSGQLPCIVATSSLELGLDIGAIELVVQIEAPPSVASGIQRVGRANHHVGGNPRGLVFPKHRGDLLACTEAVRRMLAGEIETTRYPRNALDVLAQQIVAIVASVDTITVGELFDLVRRAAPYAELKRDQLEAVLDMLSGRYPSEEFAELRPRLTWYRESDQLEARKGAKNIAIANAGVIPDRGLYGVFLAASDEKKSRRVGELDEEMVFEAREGEVFVLGASSWRIEEITQDRVLVSPAPGMPGKMPFWRGDGLGRSVELGRGIGALLRKVARASDESALRMLGEGGLDPRAAVNLVRYVRDQDDPPNQLPTDQRIVIEQFLDEVGDYRVCLLSPHGARVHIPLALCMQEKASRELQTSLEAVWSDDGVVFRFPERDEPPELAQLFPGPEEVEDLLLHALRDTPLFAAHFRECAARALLLPRRTPQRRAPLWAQRKRSASLLAVVSRYPSFPIVLETYRECLQEVFDVPALGALLADVAQHKIKVVESRTERPSPFAVSLLFNYVGNFMYDGDAPLAERKAAALSIDPTQLRELLGEAELKDLLEPDAIREAAEHAARLRYPPRHPDELHDLLLLIGDLSLAELSARLGDARDALLAPLLDKRRALALRIAGEQRVIAVEDAGRYRDALGVMPPAGLPSAYLAKADDPLADIVLRYARTHGPFTVAELRARYALPDSTLCPVLDQAVVRGRLLRGELHPDKAGITYCDVDVMRAIKRRSLASLRKQMEAVGAGTYARFLLRLHGIGDDARGLDALRNALARLEGAPVDLAVLEREFLPARVRGFSPSDLDHLLASGELVWRGAPPSAQGAGRIALYFRESFDALAPLPAIGRDRGPLVDKIREALAARGAVFFHELQRAVGGFPPDVLSALWELIWSGEATNDTLHPLRSLARGGEPDRKRGVRVSRALPGSEGRFSLLRYDPVSETERRLALVERLLLRHGVLVREAIKAEGISGGFSSVYEVLKAMEDTGRVRRGYFVEGLGAAQFVQPGVDERLRGEREPRGELTAVLLAATDPASPFGTSLPWPQSPGARPARAQGANVIIASDGRPLAWLARKERTLATFLRHDEAGRDEDATLVTQTLLRTLATGLRRVYLIAKIDGEDPERTALGAALLKAGFQTTSRGLLKRAPQRPRGAQPDTPASSNDDNDAGEDD